MIITTCRICGVAIENKFKSTQKFICSKECRSQDQIKRQTGKKRPEHSSKMKELASSGNNTKYTNTLMKKGVKFNPNVNTLDFRKKVLDNAKIVYTSEDQIDSKFKELQKIKLNNIDVYRKKIRNAIIKYPNHSLINTLRLYESLSDEELYKRYYSDIHGIFTALNLEKRGRQKLACECSKGVVQVRSSYEVNYIKFFDDNNIIWEYEPYCFRLGNKIYLPDFKIVFEGKIVWVEVKGAFWGHQKKDDYMHNIIEPFKSLISPDKLLLTFTRFPTMETFSSEVLNA